jgi:FlaA1/EpsC-like NDP-sugar epimerase
MIVRVCLIILDAALVNAGFLVAYLLRYGLPLPEKNFTPFEKSFAFLTIISIAMLAYTRCYKKRFSSSWDVFRRVASGLFFATLGSVVFVYVFRAGWGAFPTSVFAISFPVNLVLVYGVNRSVLRLAGRIRKRVVAIGDGDISGVVITTRNTSTS